jgi:hypothetical protein
MKDSLSLSLRAASTAAADFTSRIGTSDSEQARYFGSLNITTRLLNSTTRLLYVTTRLLHYY